MFRQCTEEDYEREAGGGTRHLFALDSFEFHDTMDGEGRLHHFVLEVAGGEGEDEGTRFYEADQPTMYELMARYLAGVYEMEEYELELSPAHAALLDLLEVATARARAGESDFALDDLELEAEFEDEEDEPS